MSDTPLGRLYRIAALADAIELCCEDYDQGKRVKALCAARNIAEVILKEAEASIDFLEREEAFARTDAATCGATS